MRFGMSIAAAEDPTLRNPRDAVYRRAGAPTERNEGMAAKAWTLFTTEVMPVLAGSARP